MFWNKKKDDIKLIKSVQKLEISEGDIVVFGCPYALTGEIHKNLQETIESILLKYGYKIKVIVLEGEMKISNILTKKKISLPDIYKEKE